jgi:hypothetical protein
VLSAAFPALLPVAIASLMISVAFCAAAGAQATLQKSKRRWWSRPLVTLLFFLQPIVRGWERHQSRLALRLASEDARETLDSVTLRDSGEPLDEVRYWAETRLERVDFVAKTLRELDRRGWPNRSDIGWSEFDVEVFGNRWSNVQLITAAEDHPRGPPAHPLPPARALVHASTSGAVVARRAGSDRGRLLRRLALAAGRGGRDGAGLRLLPLTAETHFAKPAHHLPRRTGQGLEAHQNPDRPIGRTARRQIQARPLRVELPAPPEAAPTAETKSPAI